MLKVMNLLASSIFFLATIGNVVVTTYFLRMKLTRVDQINWGFQIIFLMPFLPYVFGVIFETRELLCPFLIVAFYSGVVHSVLSVAVFFIDDLNYEPVELVMALVFSAVLSFICAILIILLFRRYTELVQKKIEEASDFTIDSYSIRRFGNKCFFPYSVMKF